MDSDEELFRQWQRGDASALETIVQRYHRPLLAHLYRLTGNVQCAEDLVQEAFVRLVREAQSYHYPRPFMPWFYTIARRLALTERTSAYHRHTELKAELPEPAQHEPDPAEWVERWEQQRGLHLALARLSFEQREVLSLRYGQELSVKETAELLGIPPGTVKSRTFTALRLLREMLELETLSSAEKRGDQHNG
ncbi:RNA polymerase sigma factor [Ktedonosporobacter rubrisoli]|uniref:RNA polymerase sigma factor n=1 Tax=Ktedonosporobacter rubrisoli TaxID=2509675 RepID=A0A4V0YZ87_KTERU|nr:RNA polymerase sigma factor [Ktedonosporobacter rubrisoli]QBD78861.1 RNA polymerase sigma factor [Ktedonosporobacter rubrisoli]